MKDDYELYPSVPVLAELYELSFEDEADSVQYEIDIIVDTPMLPFALSMVEQFDLESSKPYPEDTLLGVSPSYYALTTKATGQEGLIKIIALDRHIVEMNMIRIVNDISLQDNEWVDKHPILYKLYVLLGIRKPYILPSVEDIEQEVKEIYTSAGIFF